MSGQLRITAGRFRGRRIESSRAGRPTQERVREALLSRWQRELEGACVLELFCGSGAVVLEALSRGARSVYGVDQKVATARSNARSLIASEEDVGSIELFEGSLPEALSRLPRSWPVSYDLVFADPPYDFEAWRSLLAGVVTRLGVDGETVIEHSSRIELPVSVDEAGCSLERVDARRYGETSLSIYRSPRYPRAE